MKEQDKIKVLIVDDELNGRENLRGVLQTYCPEIEIVGEANCALAAIALIQSTNPSLVFLDIEMLGGNGFQVLEFFKNPTFQVVFVTAYDQYAIKAIRLSALDYILKPIDLMLVKAAIDKHQLCKKEEDSRLSHFIDNKHLPAANKRIALPLADRIHFVEIQHIVSCKGEASYTTIYTSDGNKYLVSKPLIEYTDILTEYGFLRTHKSHIVNRSHISTFIKTDGGYLLMSNGSNIPVSRRKREAVLLELKS